jgi:hypothetical protein
MINEQFIGRVVNILVERNKANKAAKDAWVAARGSRAYLNKEKDPSTGKEIDSSEEGDYHKRIMSHGTIPAWKRIGRKMAGNELETHRVTHGSESPTRTLFKPKGDESPEKRKLRKQMARRISRAAIRRQKEG